MINVLIDASLALYPGKGANVWIERNDDGSVGINFNDDEKGYDVCVTVEPWLLAAIADPANPVLFALAEVADAAPSVDAPPF